MRCAVYHRGALVENTTLFKLHVTQIRTFEECLKNIDTYSSIVAPFRNAIIQPDSRHGRNELVRKMTCEVSLEKLVLYRKSTTYCVCVWNHFVRQSRGQRHSLSGRGSSINDRHVKLAFFDPGPPYQVSSAFALPPCIKREIHGWK